MENMPLYHDEEELQEMTVEDLVDLFTQACANDSVHLVNMLITIFEYRKQIWMDDGDALKGDIMYCMPEMDEFTDTIFGYIDADRFQKIFETLLIRTPTTFVLEMLMNRNIIRPPDNDFFETVVAELMDVQEDVIDKILHAPHLSFETKERRLRIAFDPAYQHDHGYTKPVQYLNAIRASAPVQVISGKLCTTLANVYLLYRVYPVLINIFDLMCSDMHVIAQHIANSNDRQMMEWLFDELVQKTTFEIYFEIDPPIPTRIRHVQQQFVNLVLVLLEKFGELAKGTLAGQVASSPASQQTTDILHISAQIFRSYELVLQPQTRLLTLLRQLLVLSMEDGNEANVYFLLEIGIRPTTEEIQKWIFETYLTPSFVLHEMLVWYFPMAWDDMKQLGMEDSSNRTFLMAVEAQPQLASNMERWSEMRQLAKNMVSLECVIADVQQYGFKVVGMSLQELNGFEIPSQPEPRPNIALDVVKRQQQVNMADVMSSVTQLPSFLELAHCEYKIPHIADIIREKIEAFGLVVPDGKRPQQIVLDFFKYNMLSNGEALFRQDSKVQEMVLEIKNRLYPPPPL
jgi:hypothetical protein